MMFQLRTQPDVPPLTRQATLELFGFHVNNNIGRSTASSVTYNNQFPYQKIPPCYPFVKWAGGKSQLLTELYALTPPEFNRYFEPFLGGGALFFHLISAKNKRFTTAAYYISDINSELINTYLAVKDDVEKLIELLKLYETEYKKDPSAYYYKLRSNYNELVSHHRCIDSSSSSSSTTAIERAAQFITLNRTCFNGLYRVNSNGMFNVPLGDYKNPLICDSSNLRNVSLALRCLRATITIQVTDYKKPLLENATEGDFIYLDPPYNPESKTANFVGYTVYGFYEKDQRELADIFRELDKRKCKVLLSNSSTALVQNLYNDFAKYTKQVDSKRAINSKGTKRGNHKEMLIRNYSS
jgi:DNA adenine methylase